MALIKTLVTASIKGTIKISANLATSQLGEQALLHGSGPVAGVIETSSRVKSVKALLNYFPKEGGIEFVFDPKKNIFVVGKPKNPVACSLTGSPHEQLARSIGADESVVVGGIFNRGADGRILTNEQSGHFFQNWTPAIREQFIRVMKELGVNIEHSP